MIDILCIIINLAMVSGFTFVVNDDTFTKNKVEQKITAEREKYLSEHPKLR